MIKKKLSILLTLALTTLFTSGCEGLDGLLTLKNQTETEQKQESEGETDKNNDNEGDNTSEPVKVLSVNVEENEVSLYVNQTYQIIYSISPAEANQSVLYDVEDDHICEVDNQGSLTALTVGDTSVRITSVENRSKFADIDIHVLEKQTPPETITNYTVTFNANGGTGTMASQTTNGSTFIAPSCAFEYANHTFDGWALNSETGTKYNVGATIQNISSDITLFATWLENQVTPPDPQQNYTVSFNANGGSGTMSPQSTNGSTYVVPACTFTYDDHTFNGWALNSAVGDKYAVGSTISNIDSNITLFATWQENQVTPPSPTDYYAQCEGLTGSALQAKLLQINKPQSPSYDWSRYEAADEAEDDSSCILSIYTRHNIPKGNHCGSYSWTTWNREHIWTQSKYPASDKDNHNIFACEGQINNYRGNLIFDEGGTVVTVFGHTTGCKLITNVSFEPCDEAKGEVARSVMYGTVMYSYTMTNEIKSIELALKWHLEHPITSRETKRNDVVHELQGNRNPFVDHPDYACKIWGNTNSATKALCGGN